MQNLSRSNLLDRITVIVGAACLVLLIAGSWLPRSCPEIKNLLVGCPVAFVPPARDNGNPELLRIAHDDIATQDEYVDASSEATRDRTRIDFYYLSETADQAIYLKLKVQKHYVEVGTVTNPLLIDLGWPSSSDAMASLYLRNGEQTSIKDFLTKLPPKSELAVDASSAGLYHLQPTEYVSLEDLKSLAGITYVLTTFHPSVKNGVWNSYSYIIDASQADVNAKNKISLEVSADPTSSSVKPLLMGTVNVDYLLSKDTL